MQLDPQNSFSTQITPLSGHDFENVVAASYFYLGYFVKRNLTVNISKQTAAEIDVLASLITPLNEIKIAIECKGQTPSFNDLRKFSTIRQILKNENVDLNLFAYGANDIREEHLNFSKLLKIKLFKKEDLSKKVLPILWATGQLVQDRIHWINRYLAIFSVHDYLLETTLGGINELENKKEISKYKRFLYSELWSVPNPIDQLNIAFEKAQNDFHNFTSRIAQAYNTNTNHEITDPTNPIVQLAMLLELEHRIFNLIAIARCSIIARSQHGRGVIIERSPRIRGAINNLCDYNMSISKFCNFIFRWFYLWGGVIMKSNQLEELEYGLLANECGISKENVKQFINVIKEIYSAGSNLFYEDNTKLFFKYIPASFRYIGKLHRLSLLPETYENMEIFHEDDANETMANICLTPIGGVAALRFT